MRRGECRRRVGRIHAALLAYCQSLEANDPHGARRCRTGARGVGWMCALVADEATLDFRSTEAHARMRADMRRVADAAQSGGDVDAAFSEALDAYLGESRGSLLATTRPRPTLAPISAGGVEPPAR